MKEKNYDSLRETSWSWRPSDIETESGGQVRIRQAGWEERPTEGTACVVPGARKGLAPSSK